MGIDNKTFAHLNEKGGEFNPKQSSFGNRTANNCSNEMDQQLYPKQNVIGKLGNISQSSCMERKEF
mgnify:FL=1